MIVPAPSSTPAFAWSDFGIRYRPKDRNHGEPFPLPRLSRSGRKEESSVRELKQRVDGSLKALNDLASAPFDAALCPELPLTQSQKWILDDVRRRVSYYGPQPSEMDEQSALRDLIPKANLYTGEAAHLASFDMDKIKILSRRLQLLPVQDVLPPFASVYIRKASELIEKTPAEMEADREHFDPVTPYWDPLLKRDRGLRYRFYAALQEAGLLTFRRRRKAAVGFFTVKKKCGMQRLIVDAREANRNHRRPPTTRLSTVAGLADLDLSQGLAGLGPRVEIPASSLPSMAAGDVGDCFYNFSVEALASWFCAEDHDTVTNLRLAGFRIQNVFDDELGGFDAVKDSERLFFAFRGMSMGWSWALWLANEAVAHQCAVGGSLGPERFIRDKHTVPKVTRESPAVGVYVDNVNVIGLGTSSVGSLMHSIAGRFEALGIPFEVTGAAGSTVIESLGLEFDFREGCRVRNTRRRTWRLWLATRALVRRQRLSGELMRVWLGHVNYFFQLARPALSCLSSCYRFASTHLGRRGPVWPNVRREMRLIQGLLFLAEHDMLADISPVVHLGDSSMYGFSLMFAEAGPDVIRRELEVREKWRFLPGRGGDTHPGLDRDGWAPGGEDCDLSLSGEFVGSAADTPLGLQTRFGQELRERLDGFGRRRLDGQRRRLFGAPQHEEPSQIEAQFHPPVSSRWHQSSQWTLIQAAPWQDVKEHINPKEARVLVMGLRRWARSSEHFGKVVFCLATTRSQFFALKKEGQPLLL